MSLRDRLVALIELNGPMSVADWMAACLFDPEEGYYTTREPFGTGGDFTTAPEISQMFGEIVGAWLVHAWRELGSPEGAVLVEIGPGRGTLMLDVLRTFERHASALLDRIHLVETSPRLRSLQRERLEAAGRTCMWHERLATVPSGPMLLVANELFDALPAHQFVASEGRWVERCVGLVGGELAFVLGAGRLPGTPNVPDGSILEVSPARDAMMTEIAARLVRDDGAALIVDYGHEGGFGDTLQALRDGRTADPLAKPGHADLTTHVDFAALAAAATGAGAYPLGPTSQADFLLSLGLIQRAGMLGANEDEIGREAIRAAVERLAAPDAMGELFRVLAVTGRLRVLPPFADP